MAPWWLRPTADGVDDTEDQAESTRSGRRGRGRSRAKEKPEEPASLLEVVTQAAAAAEEQSPVGSGVEPIAVSGGGSPSPENEEETTPRKRSGRSRSRRGRSRSAEGEAVEEEETTPEKNALPVESVDPPRNKPSRGRKRRDDSVEVPARGGNVTLPANSEPAREIVISIPDLRPSTEEERKLALFCDLENVARGARDTGKTFDINLVLERLVEKGKIIVRKAYCDWTRYADYKRPFHEAGIELIEIPQKRYSGKNSADIRMVVDAMDLSYSKEHLDTFVLLSGDSDFSPLVSKLKENNKYVIAVGVKGSTSKILIDACDEFIYYEDIWRDVEQKPKIGDLSSKQQDLSDREQEMVGLLVETLKGLVRENKDVLWGSMIKQTIQRKRPSFNEGYYGYSTFSELLEACESMGVLQLQRDKRSGSYIVTNFAAGAGGRR